MGEFEMEELLHFVGQFDFRNEWWVLFTPLIIMGIDIVTGVVTAWAKQVFNASIMRTGLAKKVGEIMILVIGELVSYSLMLPDTIMNCISFYIIFMEIMSILENADALGIPIPKFGKDVINNANDQLQNGQHKKNEED